MAVLYEFDMSIGSRLCDSETGNAAAVPAEMASTPKT